MSTKEQVCLDAALTTAHEQIDRTCLLAILHLPNTYEAFAWASVSPIYTAFFGIAGFVMRPNATEVIAGVGEEHYETACLLVEKLRNMKNVTIILDPTTKGK